MMGSNYWFNFPVGISPFAVQGLAHPDGEIATAKGRKNCLFTDGNYDPNFIIFKIYYLEFLGLRDQA